MNLKDKTWSFSSVKAFEQCPFSFYLHYVDDEQERDNGFAQSGSFVHELLAKAYAGELYEFELADEFEEHYVEKVTERFPFYNMAKSYYETSLEYLRTFEIDDNYEIVGIEKEIHCEICGYKFVGYIDLLLRDKSDGKLIIVDHKSKSAFKKGEKEQYLLQLYLYSKKVHEEYGEYPKELWFNLYRSQQIVKSEFKKGDYAAALYWFKTAVDTILKEEEWECKPDSWYCSQLCGFTDCVYNGRE